MPRKTGRRKALTPNRAIDQFNKLRSEIGVLELAIGLDLRVNASGSAIPARPLQTPRRTAEYRR